MEHCIECGKAISTATKKRQSIRVTPKRIRVTITVEMWSCPCGGAFMDSAQCRAKDLALHNPRIVRRVNDILKGD